MYIRTLFCTMVASGLKSNNFKGERQPSQLQIQLRLRINKYSSQEYDNLTGAAADADAFEDYLKTRLNVPKQNICSLRDEEASRRAIISSFIWLRDNAAYHRDEAAIVFYFAGHGAQTQKPVEWDDWITPTGNIEMLCPSDIGTLTGMDGVRRQDEQGVVSGIPDRTISVLLSQIADLKGNNITVILDCCSSAGMVRSAKQERYAVRSIVNPPAVNSHSDVSILFSGSRGGRMAPKDLSKKHQRSHVLLAACGRENFALEDPKTKRGLFTRHLLKVLEREGIGNLTYVSLMHKLKMPERQTPHCEGDGIHWRLFNNQVSGADKSMILTKRDKEKQETILQAGSAQGITIGSRFAAHATNLIETPTQPNPCLGYFMVAHVDALSSVLILPPDSPTFRLPLLFYSKLDRLANNSIYVYSTDRAWLGSIFPSDLRSKSSVVLVDTRQCCDLELTVLDRIVYFDQHNPLVAPHIGSRMRYTAEADDVETIRNVVKASLHFYYILTRSSPCQFNDVSMELHKLSAEMTEEFDKVFIPTGQNLMAEEPATVVVDEDAPLGITIHNNSLNRALYPYLFYFDPADLTIVGWYLPPIGADAPLPPRSTLAIGHGDGGATPWSFVLPPDVKQDLGFFRLFLSTRPAPFESVLQERSPFEGGPSRSVKSTVPQILPEGEWSVQTVTLIQRQLELL
ncbi:hypothetical protein CVT25_005435 [Psilocybe cyanescens]|uniref:Peptidase C14 caspase domain-containing protein n=1 Tax=Psilocybe cyanescens TaxID=93625 RepID=A0A409XBW9_PSICY|nr:hypothetical protein CVT25_005435 [Psilocybe cyanescens]